MTVGFDNSQAPYIYTDNSVSLDRSVPSITVQLPSDDLNGIIRRAPLKGADRDLIIPGYDVYKDNTYINDDEFINDNNDIGNESYLNVNDFNTNSQNPLVQFNSKLTKFGGILKLNSASTIINKISYRILNDSKTIILTPLIMSNRLGLNFRSVNLILPNNIKNKCIRIIKNEKNKNDSNDYFLIDLLTDLDIFISIKFKLSWFLENHDGDFNSLNFYNWCNYSVPYSFSTRPPLYLYSIDELNCLLVLKDGGILKLERKETLNSEIQVIPFSDSSYIESFRSKLFSSVLNRLGNGNNNTDDNDNNNNNENEIPNYIIEDKDDKNSNKISTRAIISIAYLKEFKILITLSIDKKLKFWSLNYKKIIQEIDLNNYLPQELWKTIISKPITFELMNLIKNEINNEYYLSLLLPIGEIYLKFFKIDISFLSNNNNNNNEDNEEENSININLFEINDLNKNFQILNFYKII
ncbi:unnamed protein product [[Candida] boidinii]|nr:unnamed protein product [[Candida] boidinii]